MSLSSLVRELVDERSLEALEKLTSSRSEDVLEALVEAAAQIVADERYDANDDEIVDELRNHIVDAKPTAILIEALRSSDPAVREFALGCLGEVGDVDAVPDMVTCLRDRDEQVRDAAAAHLALLTKYDFGHDIAKWTEWHKKRLKGLEEQVVEDREDEARRLKLEMKGKNALRDEPVT